jgi:hypothetical protein
MKYIAAGIAAVFTFLVMFFFVTFVEMAAHELLGWGAYRSSLGITLRNSGLSLVPSVAVFWCIVRWRTRIATVALRKSIAARARA